MVERNQKEQMKSDIERTGTPAVAVQRLVRLRRRLRITQTGAILQLISIVLLLVNQIHLAFCFASSGAAIAWWLFVKELEQPNDRS